MTERKQIGGHWFVRYEKETYPQEEMLRRAKEFFEWANRRRTVRDFSDKPVPREVIEYAIRTASTAPSGANKQPWTFCVVENPALKKAIREAAEREEYENYHGRMSETWLRDLAHLGTDWHKPFLETAPYLIVVFKRVYELDDEGVKRQNYYVAESAGLACGMLLMALHHAGLVALTHTPSPMNFLSKLLERPDNERPFLLIPVGYPADETYVPDIKRKSLDQICVWYS
ncbi:nitroreductase family protein [Thermonema rossianum]|uniref:nitroreductase family protein n=1 Tax=Thermonema rossianum TaxID=55505 RepID=UPI00056E69EB|nr:nitroreductase family protein [Thermonema rossianum]